MRRIHLFLSSILFFPLMAQANFEIDGEAYVMFDYTDIDNMALRDDYEGNSYVRRARSSVDVTAYKQWHAQVDVGVNSYQDLKVRDAYLQYTGFDFLKIRIGRSRFPFGLEATTNSRSSTMTERSAVVQAFKNGRQEGLLFFNHTPAVNWNLGVYQVDEEDQKSTNSTGRFTWRPYKRGGALFHMGVSFIHQSWKEGQYQIKTRPEVYSADKIIISRSVNPDSIVNTGIEAAFQYEGLLLQGEWFQQNVDVVDSSLQSDSTYDGYTAQASYLMFGKKRRYKSGKFNKVKGLKYSQAIELSARFSYLNAIDNNAGSDSETFSLGANYYWRRHVKLMINYTDNIVKRANTFEQAGEAITARLQFQI